MMPHVPLRAMSRTSRSRVDWKPLTIATFGSWLTLFAQLIVGITEVGLTLREARNPTLCKVNKSVFPRYCGSIIYSSLFSSSPMRYLIS